MKHLTIDFETYEREIRAAHSRGFSECHRVLKQASKEARDGDIAEASLILIENFPKTEDYTFFCGLFGINEKGIK